MPPAHVEVAPDDPFVAYENLCLSLTRSRLDAWKKHMEWPVREVVSVSLRGWWPNTELVIEVLERGEPRTWTWLLSTDSFYFRAFPAGAIPGQGSASVLATLAYSDLSDPATDLEVPGHPRPRDPDGS